MQENEGRVGAVSGQTRIEFHVPTGTFQIFSGETTMFAGARASLLARQKKGVVRLDTAGAWESATGFDGPKPFAEGH